MANGYPTVWSCPFNGQVAAKLHVVFDPCAQRPTFFAVTPARINDNTAAKYLLPIEPGATYVFDLGYYDFAWWARLAAAGCIFVTRLKSNTPLRQTESREIAPHGCVLSDQVGFCPNGSPPAGAIRSIRKAARSPSASARKRKQQPAIPNRIVTIPRMRAKVAAPEAEDTAAAAQARSRVPRAS